MKKKRKKHQPIYTFSSKKTTFCFKANDKADLENERSNSITIAIRSWEMDSEALTLSGDLKFEIFRGKEIDLPDVEKDSAHSPTRNRELFCWFTLHTAFLPNNCDTFVLRKHQLDEICKNDLVDNEFNVYLEYNLVNEKKKKKK